MPVKRAKQTRSNAKSAGKPKKKAVAAVPGRKAPAKVTKKVAPVAAARTKKPAAEKPSALLAVVRQALEDIKAVDAKVLDVRGLTDIADTMIIASGTSDRHVKSIADRVVEYAKKAGFRPMGVEGDRDGEWVLVDLQDVILHIMLPRVREFYRLENLWDVSAARREAAGG